MFYSFSSSEISYRPKILSEGVDVIKQRIEPQIIGLGTKFTTKIYWTDSIKIPETSKNKIINALYTQTLLERTFNLDKNSMPSEVFLEHFDDRGGNRKVLLLYIPKHLPVVLKYTTNDRKPIEEQFHIMTSLRKNPELEEVIACPYGFCRVGNTVIFTEEYIDGLTRGDISLLMESRGVPKNNIDFCLSRVEGRMLSKMYNSAKSKYNPSLGFVLNDLTERNVKFFLKNGDLRAFYFDFEDYDFKMPNSIFSSYSTEILPYSEYFKNPGFALGWLEGLGVNKTNDIFRMLSIASEDKLGVLIGILVGYKKAKDLNIPSEVTKKEVLNLFLGTLFNTRDISRIEISDNILPEFKYSEDKSIIFGTLNEIKSILDDMLANQMNLEDGIDKIVDIYKRASFIKFKQNYFNF